MTDQIDADFFKLSQSQEIAQRISTILQGIRFGSIEIVVHDGRIVQIDKHEKFRVKNDSATH
ncbi:YezD family protein [Methylomonas sp. LL1]|uniref:YezD family protein n=1 Tax=Methylomonas sp. LL1 TaxID=2785785 RepID=UPI0018C3954F|nr:YezD family protein [Methylomonas sp. LL1]QPK63504.1 YezD family protein [Methylomonas sp. LL1]